MAKQVDKETLARIERAIVNFPDFPKKGVLFRHSLPILRDPELSESMIQAMCDLTSGLEFNQILGIEARGFILGPLMAQKFKKPFIPIRKKGKLPGELYSIEYALEYGSDTLEIEKDSLPKGSKCLIVDDLMATGGTVEASKRLIEMNGSQVAGCIVIIELASLNGRIKLGNTPLMTLFSY